MAFLSNKFIFCFKEIVSLTKKMIKFQKMISLTELKAMLKENKIRGYLQYNKSELVDVLIKRGLLPELSRLQPSPERENTKKERNSKYNFLKHIRNSSKKVEIRDIET